MIVCRAFQVYRSQLEMDEDLVVYSGKCRQARELIDNKLAVSKLQTIICACQANERPPIMKWDDQDVWRAVHHRSRLFYRG